MGKFCSRKMSAHQMNTLSILTFMLPAMLYTLPLSAFHSPDRLAIPTHFFKASFQSQVQNEALITSVFSFLLKHSITDLVLLISNLSFSFPHQAANILKAGRFCLSLPLPQRIMILINNTSWSLTVSQLLGLALCTD